MAYGIVFKTMVGTFLEMVQNEGVTNLDPVTGNVSNDYSLRAYHDIDTPIKSFQHFEKQICSEDYSWHISAGLGIISLSPHIIKLPDNPQELEKYFPPPDERKIEHLSGGAFSMQSPLVRVDKSILVLSVFDVAKHILDVAYGRDV